MSTSFSDTHSRRLGRRRTAIHSDQLNSWPGWAALLNGLLCGAELSRQRAALHDLADDQHLLADLGLTRQEALDEANKPFWQ
jgi:hypothetical protein